MSSTAASLRSRRCGSTLLEASVALLIFGVGAVVAAQMLAATDAQRRESQREVVAHQEAANVLERLHCLPWPDVTPEQVPTVRLSPWCTERLPEPQLKITVDTADDSPPSKHITVTLDWAVRDGTRARPVFLQAWRFAEQEARP